MVKNKKQKIWTIGHSTRSSIEFIDLLRDFDIHQIVDVRSMPGSRKFPHFNKEALKKTLHENEIAYIHMEELGGRRKPIANSKNSVWRNESFRAYADYMETDSFKKGFNQLKDLAEKKNTAIMCAEAVWWRCHRSLISDALKAQKWKVFHIMGFHQQSEHPFTDPAKMINGELNYSPD